MEVVESNKWLKLGWVTRYLFAFSHSSLNVLFILKYLEVVYHCVCSGTTRVQAVKTRMQQINGIVAAFTTRTIHVCSENTRYRTVVLVSKLYSLTVETIWLKIQYRVFMMSLMSVRNLVQINLNSPNLAPKKRQKHTHKICIVDICLLERVPFPDKSCLPRTIGCILLILIEMPTLEVKFEKLSAQLNLSALDSWCMPQFRTLLTFKESISCCLLFPSSTISGTNWSLLFSGILFVSFQVGRIQSPSKSIKRQL